MSKPPAEEMTEQRAKAVMDRLGDRPVKFRTLLKILEDGFTTNFSTVKAKLIGPLADRIAALETELAAVKATKPNFGDVYAGVWQPEVDGHERGTVVSWDGSAWIALRNTKAKPGMGAEDWRLMVKRGKDAKEIR
ncbi:hypothetical protein [Reyranella sp.]|uniref:hypothetical protein n=1 Tax=Reyranella sp. TaxID=1929291 RepID=UPI003D09D2A8